jgi:hypothetical protein
MKGNNFHFVGDSQVCVFSGRPGMVGYWPKHRTQSVFKDNWWIYHIGPHLAVNFVKHGLPAAKEVIKLYFSEEDFLCLVWGEVDCRAWIVARALLKNPQKKVFKFKEFEVAATKFSQVEEIEGEAKLCAETYLRGVDEVGLQSKNIVVIGPHPSLWEHSEAFIKEYPSAGSESERNIATKVFNEELQKGAKLRNIKFVSVFDRLIPANEHTGYYADSIHLSVEVLPLFVESFKSIGVN